MAIRKEFEWVTKIVVPMKKGRWDIYFMEKPKTSKGGFNGFDIAYLKAVSVNHPDAWKALKDAIRLVEGA